MTFKVVIFPIRLWFREIKNLLNNNLKIKIVFHQVSITEIIHILYEKTMNHTKKEDLNFQNRFEKV